MKVTVTGNKNNIYISPVTCNAYFSDAMLAEADNYSAVDLSDVTHVVVRRAGDMSFRIVQASGFSVHTGLFVRMYE